MRVFNFKDVVGAFVPKTIALLLSPLTVGVSAAQSIPHCYVGSAPCGSPDTLYRRLVDCMNDASLCDKPVERGGTQVRIGTPVPGSPIVPAPASVTSVTKSPSQERRQPVGHSTSSKSSTRERIGQDTGIDIASDMNSTDIDVEARSLTIDKSTADLNDTLPANAAEIELRLGLRRTRVVGVDMRGRTPTVFEIIEALAPGVKVAQ